MSSTLERTIAAPDRIGRPSGRTVNGPRRYLVVNGHMVEVTGTSSANSAEAFTVHPAVESAYEYLTTHHSVINAATIMETLRTMADAIQQDNTIAVKFALQGKLTVSDRLVFGNPPYPRPEHISHR